MVRKGGIDPLLLREVSRKLGFLNLERFGIVSNREIIEFE